MFKLESEKEGAMEVVLQTYTVTACKWVPVENQSLSFIHSVDDGKVWLALKETRAEI